MRPPGLVEYPRLKPVFHPRRLRPILDVTLDLPDLDDSSFATALGRSIEPIAFRSSYLPNTNAT